MEWPGGATSKYDVFKCKSWAEKSSDFNNFYLITISLCSSNLRHSVISMNFNLQFSRECIKYEALKMTFGRGPLILQKYKILQNCRQKLP